MQDQRLPGDVALSGWANCVGLAREVYLNDAGTDLMVRPVEAIKNYTDKTLVELNNKTVEEANNLIANFEGDMLYIHVEFQNVNAKTFGIKIRKNKEVLEETTYYYDTTNQTVGVKTGLSGTFSDNQNITGKYYGSLQLNSNVLEMDLYLDRSLVEGYFNNTKAISARIYPDITSLGIQVYQEGGEVVINEMVVKTMKSIYK
jgi:beta-fructofuranosidase